MSASVGAYALCVDSARRVELLEALEENSMFAEAVPEFQYSRHRALVGLISMDGPSITHVGLCRRGVRSATNRRRLNFSRVVTLSEAIRASSILDLVPSRLLRHAKSALEHGGLIGPSTAAAIIDALLQLSVDSRSLLNQYGSSRLARVRIIPQHVQAALAQQKDAVTTALSLARIDRTVLRSWDPGEAVSTSFLDGLESVRVREDAVIAADMIHVPGFEYVRTLVQGGAVFANDRTRLSIVLANRQALEQQLGVDLVYFNETHRSFVLVQYKMLEPSAAGPVFRVPNSQLSNEIARMDATLAMLNRVPEDGAHGSFRFLDNPFFLKLCPRVVFDPDNSAVVPGRYLPLELWRRLERAATTPEANGRGAIRYNELVRYMDNDAFVRIVEGAWVGTTAGQSDVLKTLLREILSSGRALVLAVKTDTVAPMVPNT